MTPNNTPQRVSRDTGEPGYALVGYYILTFGADGSYHHQGHVTAFLGDGHYLVELFSALTGSATYAQVATIHDMRAGGWRFYHQNTQWRDAAEQLQADANRDDYAPPGAPPTLGIS